MMRRLWLSSLLLLAALAVDAQSPGPEILDQSLQLRTVISGLDLPIGLAFLGRNDMLVLEKNTGRVVRVIDGVVSGTVLDLGVNNFSERGLLGIALHPRFPRNPGVYLFWTCRSTAPPTDQFFPDEERCLDANMFAADSANVLDVPLLGNRVDRFTWDGSLLHYDRNLIMLRAFQNDAAPTPPGQGDSSQPAREHGRRGRSKHPEGLCVRAPQRIRDGVRSALRLSLGTGERR